MRKQRLFALLLIGLSVLAVCYIAKNCPGEDATGALIIGFIGLYVLFTKQKIIYTRR